MPRDVKKRGKRGEKKRKRQAQDDEERAENKRPKEDEEHNEAQEEENQDEEFAPSYQQSEGEPCVPFGSAQAPNEFYGLLDEEEQAYFKKADQMLELDKFVSTDDRLLFIDSIWREALGKELKIANSQSTSRFMERLVRWSNPAQLKDLFLKFTGHFLGLVQHRFASHCCETLFLCSAPIVKEELFAGPGRRAQEGDVQVSMAEHFLRATDELQEDIGFLMTHIFASHTIRILIKVLSGLPLQEPNPQTQTSNGNNDKSSSDIYGLSKDNSKATMSIPVSFNQSLDAIISRMIGGLDPNYLRALATQPLASPVLQLLLEVEFSRSSKQNAKDQNSLFRKLLPDDPPQEGTISADFIRGLLFDPVGSHLLEKIIERAPGRMFKSIYYEQLRDRIRSMVRNDNASYILVRALERLSPEDLRDAFEQVRPDIASLLDQRRTSVIRSMVDRFHIRQLDDNDLARAFINYFGVLDNLCLVRILGLKFDPYIEPSGRENAQEHSKEGGKSHISLLLQKMLEYPGTLRKLVNDIVLAADPGVVQTACLDKYASHVIQSAFRCEHQDQIFRKTLLHKLTGNIRDLAQDPIGFHLFDALWQATTDLRFLRERVAQELQKSESLLRESHWGRIVWRTWSMDLFSKNRKSWIEKSKEIDRTSSVKQSSGAAADSSIKTNIDRARERFAARDARKGRNAFKFNRGLDQRSLDFARGVHPQEGVGDQQIGTNSVTQDRGQVTHIEALG